MISEKMQTAINEQIKLEEQSSRIYLAMASWCEANGYPGAAAFLFEHSDEERMHMLKFVHYLNDRGGYARLLPLEQTPAEFRSLKEIFEDTLNHERLVTTRINLLLKLAIEEDDYTTAIFLQWYVTEQLEEESLIKTILDKLSLAGEERGGLFHIDKELSAMAAASSAKLPG
ncbi:MAG TPA: ferritin [Bacteroidales bacterium]|nr:ferritin [Bacteroidales bacterium]